MNVEIFVVPVLWIISLTSYAVYFRDDTEVDVQADSLEAAARNARECTNSDMPFARMLEQEF